MARKKKTVSLSTDGINEFIESVKRYHEELREKTELYLELVLEMGQKVCEENATPEGDPDMAIPDFKFELEWFGDTLVGKLIGKGSDITFIEFGSGVFYNGNVHSSPHELGESMEMKIGEFPGPSFDWFGVSQGGYPGMWYYNGKTHYGIEAGMPMWKAAKEIREREREIAEKVFG